MPRTATRHKQKRSGSAGRPRDPGVSRAITEATLRLLTERGFARMSIDAIALEAGVGKPAIYRRFRDKAELVVAAIATQLPVLDVPDLGDTRAEMQQALAQGFPSDGPGYVGLIGGLISEQHHHPELIAAFRENVLLPRRALVRLVIERGQARNDIDPDIDPEMAIDMLAGQLLARTFAGHNTGARWRKRAFEFWWTTLTNKPRRK